MAIRDLDRTVLTRYEADTSGMERGVERVKGGVAELSRSWGDAAKSISKFGKDAEKTLANIKSHFNLIADAARFANDAIQGWGKDLRLEATNAGISIDRLSKAFRGLVDDDTLNEFAAKTVHGTLKLTQQQIETLGEAAVALRGRGHDVNKTLEAMQDALESGRMKGLRPFFGEIKEGESKFETLQNVMAAATKTIADAQEPINKQADAVQQLAVNWANLTDSVKNYFAEWALGVANYDPSAVLGAAGFLAGEWNPQAVASQQGWESFMGAFQSPSLTGAQNYGLQRQFIGGYLGGRDITRSLQQPRKTTRPTRSRAGGGGVGSYNLGVEESRGINVTLGEGLAPFSAEMSTGMLDSADQIDEAFHRVYDSLLTVDEQYANFLANQPSILEKLGLHDPDAWEMAAKMIGTVGDAYKSALKDIGSGEMSAAQVARKAFGSIVSGIGDMLAAKSAASFVEAAAAAYTMNWVAAGQFAAAGGAYGVGAVAAYTAAHALGASGGHAAPSHASAGGGGGYSGSRGPSGGSAYASAANQQQGNGPTIVYYGGYAQGTPRMTQLQAESLVSQAFGNGIPGAER